MFVISNAFFNQVELVQTDRWRHGPIEIVLVDNSSNHPGPERFAVTFAMHAWNASHAGGFLRPGDIFDKVVGKVPGIQRRRNANIFLAPRQGTGATALHFMLASLLSDTVLEKAGLERPRSNFSLSLMNWTAPPAFCVHSPRGKIHSGGYAQNAPGSKHENGQSMNKDFCIVPLILALAGCGAPAIVRFPADSQSAKLRYITSAARSDDTYLWRIERSQCPAVTKPVLIATTGELEKSDIAMFGSTDQPQAQIRELNVPASEPLTFYLAAYRYGVYSCDNAGVFQPLPGRQYELRYIVEPTTYVCIVQVDQLEQSAGGQVTRQREPTAHFFHPPKKAADYCGEALRPTDNSRSF